MKTTIIEAARTLVEDSSAKVDRSFLKHAKERYKKAMEPLLDKIDAALAGGEIWNADWTEAKDLLTRIFDDARTGFDPGLQDRYKAYREKNPDHFGGMALYDYTSGVYPHMISGKLKKLRQEGVKNELQKAAPWFTDESYKALVKVYEEFEEIADVMKRLKDKVIKGRKPNPDAKPAYQPPPASTKSLSMVREKVEEVTEEMYEDMVISYKKYFEDMVDRYFARRRSEDESPYSMSEFRGGNAGIVNSFITQKREGSSAIGSTKDPYRKRDDYKEKIEQAAKRQADTVRDRYKLKMMHKLGSIVGKKVEKGVELKVVKVGHLHAYAGTFEGSLFFEFEDGSSFRVLNKVVTKWPARGNPFHQYPTTFHDVQTPNGNTYKMRSQEQMNKDFIDLGTNESEK